MAYANSHVLLAWGGRMPGNEQWTNTLRMRGIFGTPGVGTQAQVASFLSGGWKTALDTWWAAIQNNVGVGTYLDWMKANRVGTDGKYMDAETNRYDFPTPVQGIATAVPNQLAYVVSTLTTQRAGRAHIGRFFIPSAAIAVSGTTGRITADVSVAYLTDTRTFINSLNTTAALAYKAAVMSNLGAGVDHDIIGVGGGLVIDTQRRRRNKITEARVEVAL